MIKIISHPLIKKSFFLYILLFNFLYSNSIDDFLQTTTDYIIIKCVGDVMLGSYTPKPIIPKSTSIFDKIAPYLSSADVVICNLEGVFITEDFTPKEKKLNKKNNYVFGMPKELAKVLKNLNINLVSMNNNHIMDYGKQAYEYTKSLLNELGILYATEEDIAKLVVKDTKVAMVAFSFCSSKLSILNISQAEKTIKKLKEDGFIVIVSFHGGAEGQQAMHTKNQTEYFLSENRGNVVKFAKAAIDAGADLVFGHGPHVLRAIELYKNKLIAYSLGNFLTYGNFNLEEERKYAGILEVYLKKDGGFIKANFIPTLQLYPGVPVYDENKTSIKLINRLGSIDFPDTYYKLE